MLEPLQEAHDRAFEASGYVEADAKSTEAQENANEALFAVFETSPTSPAGALALLLPRWPAPQTRMELRPMPEHGMGRGANQAASDLVTIFSRLGALGAAE